MCDFTRPRAGKSFGGRVADPADGAVSTVMTFTCFGAPLPWSLQEKGLWVALAASRVTRIQPTSPSRSVSLWRRGEELPGPGHALELMFTSFRECDVGSSDEVLDCA